MAFEAILRIEGALSIATRVSLRSFHRPAFEARGNWPQALDGVRCGWNPLALE